MKLKLVLCLGLVSLAIGACSTETKKEKEIDQKVSQETAVGLPGEAAANGRDAIESSKGLTAEQKEKIHAIMNKTQVEVQNLRIETNQLKATLFKSFADGTYKPADIAILKKRLTKIESKKMDAMFSSLEQVQKILGYTKDKKPSDFELHNLYRDML